MNRCKSIHLIAVALTLAAAATLPAIAATHPCGDSSGDTSKIEMLYNPASVPWEAGAGNHWCFTSPSSLSLPIEFRVRISGLDRDSTDETAGQRVRAGQFFLLCSLDNCSADAFAFNFFNIEPGEPGNAPNPDQSPFQQEISSIWQPPSAPGQLGLLGYTVGIPFGQPMEACDNDLATFVFTPISQGKLKLWFRDPSELPATMLTNDLGEEVELEAFGQMNEQNCMLIIVDWTDPEIFCPADITIECDEPQDPGHTGEATATDNCDDAPAISYSDQRIDGVCEDRYTILRTWTATDECGNESFCVQAITVVDTHAPVFDNCPTDITVECDAVPVPALVTATDNCDPNPVVTFVETRTDGNCDDNYTLERKWVAKDRCDNEATCTQIITVQDITDPVITCPGDTTIECSDSQDPANTGEATATDNCDPDPVIGHSDNIVPGSCEDNYTIERTWTATDRCGNDASCLQTITVQDTTDPVITCPPDITIECDEPQDPGHTGEATATDNCDPDPVIDYTDIIVPGSCADNYTIERTWTATDRCGNDVSCLQTITVQDTIAPVITCPGPITIECDESQLPADTGEATATDNCDPDPVIDYSDNIVSGSCADNYTIERAWTATDRCGNDASCLQTITVQDTTAPTFDNCPTQDETVECDNVPTPPAVTATDNCDPSPSVTFNETRIDGSCDDTYTLVWTWTATDRCGNSDTCVQNIYVQDTMAPQFKNCPSQDLTVECDNIPVPTTVYAIDNCDPDPDVAFAETEEPGSCDDEYTLVRTWTATDRCGNSDTCVQRIYVQDTTDPVITCPLDITIECDEPQDPANTGEATATDNCDPNPVIDYTDNVVPGPCLHEYTIERTWTATDRCGNDAPCMQTITVVDTVDPIIACPPDITIECDEPQDPGHTGEATATDNCDSDPFIDYSDTIVPGPCPDTYDIEREWCAEDECGNIACCTQIIHVRDTTPPEFTQCDDITVTPLVPAGGLCEVDVDVTPLVLVTDNCDLDVTLECERDDGLACTDPYPCGVTTVTWTATDNCDNVSTCDLLVTVNAEVAFEVTVELLGVTKPVTRCITLEAFMCESTGSTCPSQDMPQVVEQNVDFVVPAMGDFVIGTATFTLPCAQYSCITARDPLHTLRRTIDPIPVIGDSFVLEFTDAMGKGLIGGNLNDDCWIDVKDYGLFAGVWAQVYDPPTSSPCGTVGPHADFTGDGRVWTGDYTFILLNMLDYSEANCCGMDPICDGLSMYGAGPCQFISVQQLRDEGVLDAAAGDLNEDGWIDMQDIAMFSQGERPKPSNREPKLGPADRPTLEPNQPADDGKLEAQTDEEDEEPGLTAHQF